MRGSYSYFVVDFWGRSCVSTIVVEVDRMRNQDEGEFKHSTTISVRRTGFSVFDLAAIMVAVAIR
jgi:hypothetical protein